ncbi:hypothetical protein ABW20_dc0104748 [Dactylellina cionopaga]|nr:hypothetical protein ABW20_dc0104748 [Dactylellina cionopaga]
MSLTLRKLQLRAATAADGFEHRASHIPLPASPALPMPDVSTRIHKIENELAHLPFDSPFRKNYQAILRDYREKGGADMMYQNGRALDVINVDLRRGPLYVERCSISIVSDDEDDA